MEKPKVCYKSKEMQRTLRISDRGRRGHATLLTVKLESLVDFARFISSPLIAPSSVLASPLVFVKVIINLSFLCDFVTRWFNTVHDATSRTRAGWPNVFGDLNTHVLRAHEARSDRQSQV